MENYICINGKKAELTEEQMRALGIELPKKNPFARVIPYDEFYFINSLGQVEISHDGGSCAIGSCDDKRFNIANYCTDKSIMEQRALHETLNRLLWRYAMEHKSNNKVNGVCIKHYIDEWIVFHLGFNEKIPGIVYFDNEAIAKNAIKEIIEPFMKAHPEFKF